jgi:hypothetical protein
MPLVYGKNTDRVVLARTGKFDSSGPYLASGPLLAYIHIIKMSCKHCNRLDREHAKRPAVTAAADEVRIDGMLCQDLNKFKVTARTCQIYCPPDANEHLFMHRFKIGQVIAIPQWTWVTTDGYESGSTTSEWTKRVKIVQLVRITSEPRSGAMPGRAVFETSSKTEVRFSTYGAPFKAIHCDIEVLGTTKDEAVLEYCVYRGSIKSTATKVKIDAIRRKLLRYSHLDYE